MKYRTQKRIQGSISLLLVIILLPMMTFSAIIVDLSRINMAKQMLSSAGDLTMNSALANYDTILKDVYGLFAMSQQEGMSNEELGEELNTYFAKTISAYGVVGEADAASYVDALIGDFTDILNGVPQNTVNFLEMKDISVTAQKLPDSSLANPSVLRKQIVEYMKYRAPLGVGMSFLEAITGFEKVDEQNTVVQAQVKAQESTQTVAQACKKLIELIRSYDKRVKELNTALTGVSDSEDTATIPLEDYDSHPMKYLDAWGENYTHINKLNLVFQANPPSADSVYLKDLNYSAGQRFVDSSGNVLRGSNTGIKVNVTLAGNTAAAQSQVETQVRNLNDHYSGYQNLYGAPILKSTFLTLKNNGMDSAYLTPEKEDGAIAGFIQFENFLLNQGSGITYNQMKQLLEQLAVLAEYLNNFQNKINGDISYATGQRDSAYNTWQRYLTQRNNAGGEMSTRITNINKTLEGYLEDEEALSSIGDLSAYRQNYIIGVVSQLPGRSVGYESYYRTNIGNRTTDNWDKYIECFDWLVFSSGLGTKGSEAEKKIISETVTYLNRYGYDKNGYHSYMKGKLSASEEKEDLFLLLGCLKTCHAYAITYREYISTYNTANTKASDAQQVYNSWKNEVIRLNNLKTSVTNSAKGCAQGYRTVCANYQGDAYYYKYYIIAAQNTIGPEAKAIATHFSKLLDHLEELRGDLDAISSQITKVKTAITDYKKNVESWDKANQSYVTANGSDSFSTQSGEDVKKSLEEYDEKLYDTLDLFVVGMWDEFDELYSELTKEGNFVYGTKELENIQSAKDLKDALAGTDFSAVVTVEEAAQKLSRLYKASTVEYDPYALHQPVEGGDLKQLCFLEETIVPLQALRYLDTMYPPDDTEKTETQKTDESNYNTAKEQLTGSGSSDSGSSDSGSSDSGSGGSSGEGTAKGDFEYSFQKKTVPAGVPSESHETEKKTQKEEEFRIDASTNEDGVEELDAEGGLQKQSGASNDVLKNIANVATAAMENLYILDYVFQNFSYNTIIQEQVLEDNEDKVTGNSIITKMTQVNGLYADAAAVDAAKEKVVTLSNWPINPHNNYLYGAEIEYILFGNSKASTNVTTAKASIYALRFAFNCIYAFTDSEIRNSTMAAGVAVQAATLGIVPYQVVQIVLQLALAAAEAALDLSAISCGLKVAVIKTKDTWALSIGGAKAVLTDAGNALAEQVTEKMVQNTMDKLMDGLNSVMDAGASELKGALTNMISSVSSAAKGVVEGVVDDVFAQISTALDANVNELLNTRTGEILENGLDRLPTKQEVRAKAVELFAATKGQVDTIVNEAVGDNEMAQSIAAILVSRANTMISDMETEVLAVIDSAEDGVDITTVLTKELTRLREKITSLGATFLSGIESHVTAATTGAVDKVQQELTGYLKECGDELSEKAAEAIKEKVKGCTDQFVDKTLKLSGKNTAGNVKSSPLSMFRFGYKDYLMLLTYISICTGDSVLLRTADTIEMNLSNLGEKSSYTHGANTEDGGFQMKNACTYVSITATAKLDMFFMDMSLFRDQVTEESEWEDTNNAAQTEGDGGSDGSTEITYTGLLGY